MAGENSYKEFDTASVITTSTTKDTVSIGKYALRKRELLLGLVAIVALLGVLVLAIVLAVKASESDSNNKSDMAKASTSKQTGGTGGTGGAGGTVEVDYCHTPECLQVSTYQRPIINENMDPCRDFYTYACGHYKDHHMQTPLLNDVTAQNEIIDLNQQRLAYLTLYPIEKNQPNSYEKKFQEFISACNNHFDKMELRGTPMIQHLIRPAGGWWVFGDNVLESFSLQETLEKVHIDFWTDAFFNVFVKTNINNWNEAVVELDFGGLGLSYLFYRQSTDLQPIQYYYKLYMTQLATMLQVDNGQTPDTDRIDTFSEDAFEVESHIAQFLYRSEALRNPHHPDSLMTLGELTDHLNGTIDMVHYMKTLFNEHPSKFEEDTKVAVARLGYFDKLGNVLATYLNSEEGQRKLHNYLMWRLIQNYVNDLSWDYVHAARKLNHVMYGYKDDTSGFSRCFSTAVFNFPEVINALFARHFVKEDGKKAAENILDNIKPVLLQGIDDMPWMSRTNKDYAMRKIRDSLYKISFPKEILDDDYLNDRYALAEVNIEDYFGSIISLHKMKRQIYNRYYGAPNTRTEWAYHIFEPKMTYYNPWHELVVTSAFLQNPLFSSKGPKYYNYGGVGSRIAKNLIHAIDEIGANYKEDGSHLENWWTQTTVDKYSKIKQCAIESQKDKPIGPFLGDSGRMVSVNSSLYANIYTPTMLADASGARLSYMAYKDLMKKEGAEKLPPGFQKYTHDQMFFLSFAQSYCQNTPDNLKYAQLQQTGQYPSKNRVNLAMQHIPEFQKAFQCPSIDNRPKPCLLFDL